jgi:hypothetical protein
MKIKAVVFHQPVELPTTRRNNVNTVSEETFPGVHIEMVDHLVTLSHKDWPHDIVVGTANVRFASLYKDSKLEQLNTEKCQNLVDKNQIDLVKEVEKATKKKNVSRK